MRLGGLERLNPPSVSPSFARFFFVICFSRRENEGEPEGEQRENK